MNKFPFRFFTSSMMFWFRSQPAIAAPTRSIIPTHWTSSPTLIPLTLDHIVFAAFISAWYWIKKNHFLLLMATTLSSSQSKKVSRWAFSLSQWAFSAISSNGNLITIIIHSTFNSLHLALTWLTRRLLMDMLFRITSFSPLLHTWNIRTRPKLSRTIWKWQQRFSLKTMENKRKVSRNDK